MVTGRKLYDGYRFFNYAMPTAISAEYDARRRAFQGLNARIAGGDKKYHDHALKVGNPQAVEDYICGLVEAGVIPYRERYQARFTDRRGFA